VSQELELATFLLNSDAPPPQQNKVKSEQDQARDAILYMLGQWGGTLVQDEAILFQGTQVILPAQFSGRVSEAITFLQKYEKDQRATYNFSRTYRFRPWDGAAAFQRAMKRLFGTAGIGQKTYGLFGKEFPPEYVTIAVGPDKTESVPWGRVSLDLLDATFDLGAAKDKEYGTLFVLSVEAPKRYRAHIAAFFEAVAQELEDRSIYRGQAINGAAQPAFLSVTGLDPNSVIYADETLRQLGANIWSALDYSDTMRRNKISLKRSVLLEGPYGTGKSLGGLLTAQRAVRNGWTFILVRPGQDDLAEALKTAQVYAPAVVWFEDIDVVSAGADTGQMSQILDMLDSVTNKGVEVIAGFTTNHVERLPKGVLRPGRIDAIIHIGGLDVSGYRELTESVIPKELRGDIDYEQVAKAFLYHEVKDGETVVINGVTVVKDNKVFDDGFGYIQREDGRIVHEGYLPAFAKEAVERSLRYVIARTGKPGVIETDDLVASAKGLLRQRELMVRADEGVARTSLEGELRKTVGRQVGQTLREHQVGHLPIVVADADE
jgi:transitional endoplasmic reticulum ATPase